MKLKVLVVDLELTRRQKRIAGAALAMTVALSAGITLAAPKTFAAGETLKAADLNANFAEIADNVSELDGRVVTIEWQVFSKDGNNGTQSCDAWCVQTAMGSPAEAGTCVGAFENGGTYRSCSSTNLNLAGVFCYCSRY